jgi:hypothetical protein
LKWKRIKDFCTLSKNWIEVFKSIIVWYHSIKEERLIVQEMESYNDEIVGETAKTAKLVRRLIN